MLPQQVVATNTNQPKKNFFKNVALKVKNLWLSLSWKYKILFSILLIQISLLGLYLVGNIAGSITRHLTERASLQQTDEGFTKLQIPEREPPFFSLRPKTKSRFGILPQEVFILTSREPVDKNFVEQRLESNFPIKITPVSATEFEITTQSLIKNDEAVSISLPVKNEEIGGHIFDRNYGWTYQVQGKFRVKSCIPGDEKINIPLDTGIEIVFSQDDYKDPTSLISIKPSIKWRGERHVETFAIVPLEPLKSETVYTVTLKEGLNLEFRNDPIKEDYSFSFQTQEAEVFDKKAYPPTISLNRNFVQVSTTEAPAIEVFASSWKEDFVLKTRVYKFPGEDQFLESRKKIDQALSSWYKYFAEKEEISTEGLAKVSELELKVATRNSFNYIQFPGPLSQGFYLIQFWYDEGKKLEQLWLQSTDLSAYTSVGRRHTLVWVNNVKSAEAVGGANISPVGTEANFFTNEDGLVVFPTPQSFFESLPRYLKVAKGEEKLILPIKSLETGDRQRQPSDYWSYLYHERNLYKPGDTLYFWGVVKERDSGQTPLGVKASVSSSYYDSETSELISLDVYPEADGSFIGKIPLGNLSQSWYLLNLKVGDVELTYSQFRITEYEKPEIKIEVTSDKNAVFAGEGVNFSARVTFFDETPAKKIPLSIHEGRSGSVAQLTTDEKGEINYSYQPKYSEGASYPRYENITITTDLAQDTKVEGYGSVLVYGAKLMMETKAHQEDNKAVLSATVYRVNLDNLNKGISYDVKGDVVAGKEVRVKITKTWWEEIPTGTYYDFIEKTTRPSYRYDRHDEEVLDSRLKTNANGVVSHEFNLEKGKSYETILSLEDEDKHPVDAREYFYYYEGYRSYAADEFAQPTLSLERKENKFSLGEKVSLNIEYKGEDYPATDKNRFLFILAQRGIQEFFVENQPKFSFIFQPKHIPNTYVAAVVFDGNYYRLVFSSCQWDWTCFYYGYYDEYYFNALEISYKEEDNKLDLSIKSGQEKYKPSDVARITISVSKQGSPVPNTQVNLILVDQALEAIGGVIKPDILTKLYRSVPTEIYYHYYSHKPVFPKSPGAEMGGGGEERREVFKDTSFFGQARTNEEGLATFEFKLPDDITTWLIYAQALSGNLEAGQAEGKLVSTKDFFVTSNFPREFLQRDEVYLSANGFGVKVAPDQTVSYELTYLQGNTELQKLKGQAQSSKDRTFGFPDLTTGEYKVWLKGSVGDLVDGVVYPFKVINSRLDMQMEKKFKLEAGQDLKTFDLASIREDKPVKLVITDIGKGQYYYQLYNYCYYLSSNRLEKRLAQKKAYLILNQRFQEELCDVPDQELAAFQNFDGGLAQVSWGGSNLETTVWALFVHPQPFNKEKLISYLEQELGRAGSRTPQKIYALWGLTLLGKPQINELRTHAQHAVSFEEKAISAIALASIGELEVSREAYYDLLADYAYINKPYIRLQAKSLASTESIDKYVTDTALVLLLSSMVERNYSDGLYAYLRDYQSQAKDIVLDLGKISFINEELDKLPDEITKVDFKSASREASFDLSRGKRVSLTLLQGEIQSSNISVSRGKAEVILHYFAAPEILSQIKRDDRLVLKRNYSKAKEGSGAYQLGDIVEIKVDFDLDKRAPLGCYVITDHLPSGLIFIQNPGIYGLGYKGWVNQEKPNIIKYHFCHSPWWRVFGIKAFSYYARVSAVGTYIGEPAIMQSELDLSILQATQEDVIRVESPN